jgi:phage shock protein E
MKTLWIISGILVIIYVSYKIYTIYNLDKGLDKLIKNGAVILDVRTASEYETGHIGGSTNIALSKLRTDRIPFDTNLVIITCCSHGLRSIKAIELLNNRGYRKVHNGGAWSDLEKLTMKH